MKRMLMLIIAASLALSACGSDPESKKGNSETPSTTPDQENPVANSDPGGFEQPSGNVQVSTSFSSSTAYSDLSTEEREQFCSEIADTADYPTVRQQLCDVLSITFSEGDPAQCAQVRQGCSAEDEPVDICGDLDESCSATVGDFVDCTQERLEIVMAIDAPPCDALTPEVFERVSEEFDAAEAPAECAAVDAC